jgi:Thioesterase domain
VATELARFLRRAYGRKPHALFASSRRAPHVPDTDPFTSDLPHDQFLEELRRIDGTPAEVLEHAEMIELLITLLRADFQLIQTYEYTEGVLPYLHLSRRAGFCVLSKVWSIPRICCSISRARCCSETAISLRFGNGHQKGAGRDRPENAV